MKKNTSLAEVSVIGGIIGFPADCGFAFQLLKPEMFENKWLGDVFSICEQIKNGGGLPDIVMVEERLGTKEHRAALVKCVDTIPALEGFEGYCMAVFENWRRRTLTAELTEITLSRTGSAEMTAMLLTAAARQQAIESALADKTAVDFWGAVMRFIDSLCRPNDGIKTGWSALNRCTGGLRRKGFYIISGRPGRGKTDFALSLAVNIASAHRVTYCTMEMPTEQVMERIASRLAHVDGSKLRDKTLTPEEMDAVTSALGWQKEKLQLTIEEQQSLTVEDIEGKLLKHRAQVLIIDHIGLMKHTARKNRWESVADTSERLKKLALKHNVVIIALVQENRQAQKTASDISLKGSDNLSNDADGIFQMRSERPEKFLSGEAWVEAEVCVTKNRHGGCGTLKFYWQPQYHEWRVIDDRMA